MFGKVASIGIVLATVSLGSIARGADGDIATDAYALNPAAHRDLALPQTAPEPTAGILPKTKNDIPTAPLPPAFWPGLWVLATLAGTKVMLSARKRLIAG